MKMFLLGALIMYLLSGLVFFIANGKSKIVENIFFWWINLISIGFDYFGIISSGLSNPKLSWLLIKNGLSPWSAVSRVLEKDDDFLNKYINLINPKIKTRIQDYINSTIGREVKWQI